MQNFKIIVALTGLFLRMEPSFAWLIGHPCDTNRARRFVRCMSNDPEALRDKARRLREEVAQFEQRKQEETRLAEEKQVEEERVTDLEVARHSAVLPILKGDGSTVDEQIRFPPRFVEPSSILVLETRLPLGIILGEQKDAIGIVTIDEVGINGNGDIAGAREGDIIRAVTACKVEMEMPTWQLLAGGIGRPKTKRFMFSTDGKSLEEVMDAVASNRMDPDERPMLLVVERADS